MRPDAPPAERNGNYKHGRFTNKAIESRRILNALIKHMRGIAEQA